MNRRIDQKLALQIAVRLQDWIPLSEARALTWSTDLLGASPQDEDSRKTAQRINEAAKQAARAQRDVRYHDVFDAFTKLLKREIEEPVGDPSTASIPAMTGDPHLNKFAASSVISDMLDGRIRGDEVESEIEKRRRMTLAEIEAHRSELVAQRPLPKLPGARGVR